MPLRPRHGRKLLVASLGVATLNYGVVSCGNPMPPPRDAGADAASDGHVVALPEAGGDATNDATNDGAAVDAGTADAARDVVEDLPVANLAVP